MIRKNLIVLMHEDQMTNCDVMSISSFIPGGLGAFETIPEIKKMVARIKLANADYFKYGASLKQELTSLKNATKITFTQNTTSDFKIDTTYNTVNTEEGLPICENIYIINICSTYKNVECDSELFPNDINANGLFIAPNSIIVLGYESDAGRFVYEIEAREKL